LFSAQHCRASAQQSGLAADVQHAFVPLSQQARFRAQQSPLPAETGTLRAAAKVPPAISPSNIVTPNNAFVAITISPVQE
jgi:hypothetical protein